ncbi:MAG: nucleotide exchange factor GrpE [bacterium]
MIGWAVAAVILLASAAYILWSRSNHQRHLEQVTGDHANRMIEVRTEAEKRVDRIERASSLDQARAHHRLVKEILPALDALDEAAHYAQDVGLELVSKRFDDALAKHNVTRIQPNRGEAFDPAFHEAIEKSPADVPNNCVSKLHRVGWRDGEVVLRPAMVSVSSGPQASEDSPNAAENEDDEVVTSQDSIDHVP